MTSHYYYNYSTNFLMYFGLYRIIEKDPIVPIMSRILTKHMKFNPHKIEMELGSIIPSSVIHYNCNTYVCGETAISNGYLLHHSYLKYIKALSLHFMSICDSSQVNIICKILDYIPDEYYEFMRLRTLNVISDPSSLVIMLDSAFMSEDFDAAIHPRYFRLCFNKHHYIKNLCMAMIHRDIRHVKYQILMVVAYLRHNNVRLMVIQPGGVIFDEFGMQTEITLYAFFALYMSNYITF